MSWHEFQRKTSFQFQHPWHWYMLQDKYWLQFRNDDWINFIILKYSLTAVKYTKRHIYHYSRIRLSCLHSIILSKVNSYSHQTYQFVGSEKIRIHSFQNISFQNNDWREICQFIKAVIGDQSIHICTRLGSSLIGSH